MCKDWAKDWLHPGYLVRVRNGKFMLVMAVRNIDNLVLVTSEPYKEYTSTLYLRDYNDDMTNKQDFNHDIMEVYDYPINCKYVLDVLSYSNRNLLYKREGARRVTKSELRRALGFDFELAEDENND